MFRYLLNDCTDTMGVYPGVDNAHDNLVFTCTKIKSVQFGVSMCDREKQLRQGIVVSLRFLSFDCILSCVFQCIHESVAQ